MPDPRTRDQPRDTIAAARRALLDAASCPACEAPLAAGWCVACGLDLRGPAGRELWMLSQEAEAALGRRVAHIARMRAGQLRPAAAAVPRTPVPQPLVPQPPVAERAVPVRPTAAAPPTTHPQAAVPQPWAPAAPAPSVGRAVGTRPAWRVQTVLQVLGALLLAAACIVFLLFSWGWLGLVGRAAVIGVGTVVVFAVASRLRRAELGSSAEAVGGLATVMLLLDAWAVRATGLVDGASDALYAAVACLVCGVLLGAWGTRARLRVGTAAACVLVPLSPVLLAPLTGAVGLPWLLAASLALTTVRFVATPALGSVERAVLGVVAGAAACLAAGSALVGLAVPDATRSWSAAGALLVLAGITAVEGRCAGRPAAGVATSGADRPVAVDGQAAAATTLARPTAWAAAAGTLLALGAAALALAAVRTGLPPTTLAVLGPLGAGAASVALTSLSRRQAPAPQVPAGVLDRRPPGPAATPPLRAASRGALAVTLCTGLPAVAVLLWVLLGQASAQPAAVAPLTAAAAAGGALVVAATLRLCSVQAAARVVAAWTTVAALLSLPGTLTASWPGTSPLGRVAMLTGLVALALLADRRPLLLDGRSRTPVRALTALAALLALVGGRDTLATGVALLVCGGVVLVARSWTPTGTGLRPLLLAGAIGLGWLGVVMTTAVRWDPAQVALALAAVLLVAGAVVTLARAPWGGGDRRAVLGSAAVLSLAGWWMGAVHLTPGTPTVHRVAVVAVPALATLVAVLVAARGGALLGVPTRAAGAVVGASLAPATVLAIGVASSGTVAWSALTVAAAAVAGACVLLAAPSSGSDETVRRSGEVAAWSMLTLQLLVLLGHISSPGGPERTALVVALAALTAGCWSLRPDRRWARWWALGLATCASWVLLGSDRVGAPEAYLAPTGLVLLVVALRRVVRSQGHDVPLLAAGLGLLTLPTALLGGTLGTSAAPRALLSLGAATVLVALGAAQRPAPAPTGEVSHRDVLCAIGVLGALLGPALHALVAAADGHRAPSGVEAYSLPAAALLVVARQALSQDRYPQAEGGATGRAARHPAVLWVVAAVAVLPTLVATDASTTGLVRWLAVLAAAGTLMLLGATSVPRVGLLAIGATAGSLATVAASASGAVRPFEVPVVAFAVLVIATATVLAWHGRHSAGWTVVGPVLLGAAVVGPPAPWRAPMGLGIAAVLLGVGIVLRRAAADSAPPGPVTGPAAGTAAAPVPLVAAFVVAGLVVLGHGVVPPVGPPARFLDVEVWSVPATGVVAVALVLLASTWPFAGAGPRTWGLPLVVTLATAPTLLAVDGTGAGSLRVAVVLLGGGALALTSVLRPERVPGPRAALVTGLVAAGAATLAAVVHPYVVPADAVLCAYGVLLVAVGLARMGRSATVGSWDALGAGLVLALVVPLGTGWVEPTTWRLLLVVTGALGAVVVGAVRRWQAPFVLGAATLATVALVQVTPAAVAAVRVVEWWVVLAAVGAVLLGLGLTYERRLREAREATRFVATMR